ncbi:hypothetical protein FKW77_000940 [Venturia effusa]|uniref:7-alpha-hydroxysteroid dehydrogenase n=1 Tax=Venturia effusa TaxID=50376 RepID=A0A517LM49_9PEZI|nr:hypothetical protein FKW77_000940 [Venturia effusa]
MASNLYAIIAGVGPGTGAALALKFAKKYPVVLLARRPESYLTLVEDIKKDGGEAVGISTDVASEESVKKAFEKIEGVFGKEGACAAAIFNASGRLSRKPFLEQTIDEFSNPYDVNCRGGFLFSQAILPHLLRASQSTPPLPPSLIFTGATASLKASATFSSFAVGKFATRALAQSLAREFGPKGVHVAHVIIDGVIDLESSKEYLKDSGPDAKIDPQAIADTYWYLHTQPRSAFTFEMEVRPFIEKW